MKNIKNKKKLISFFKFLEKISPDYETDQIKELILCEEENIDIDFMTQEFSLIFMITAKI